MARLMGATTQLRVLLTDPRDTLGAVASDLADCLRDMDALTHDQRVPLVEKIRLQRIQAQVRESRDDLVRMMRRAEQSGWQVTQEGSSHESSSGGEGTPHVTVVE